MHTKEFSARVKAVGNADGLDDGQFEAIVSVFGNVDSYGDVVMPGAFTQTLADWAAKGDPIPVIWSHDWRDPMSHVGVVLAAEEREDGLWVRSQIDTTDNPRALQVLRLLRGRRVTQFSFGFDVIEAGWGEREGSEYGVYELRQLKLHEVGPCLLGVNQETELLAVKAADIVRGAKAGRVLSQSNRDRLTTARTAIDEVLATAEEAAAPDPKSSPAPGDREPSSHQEEKAGQAPQRAAADEVPDGAPESAAKSAPSPAQVDAWIFIHEQEQEHAHA